LPTAYLLQPKPPGAIPVDSFANCKNGDNLVLIILNFEWCEYEIKDEFTWSIFNKDTEEMRKFARNLLEDLLDKDFGCFSHEQITIFEEKVIYEISRQIQSAEKIRKINWGVSLGSGHGLKNEYLVKIDINIKDNYIEIHDTIEWDLSNPKNLYFYYILAL